MGSNPLVLKEELNPGAPICRLPGKYGKTPLTHFKNTLKRTTSIPTLKNRALITGHQAASPACRRIWSTAVLLPSPVEDESQTHPWHRLSHQWLPQSTQESQAALRKGCRKVLSSFSLPSPTFGACNTQLGTDSKLQTAPRTLLCGQFPTQPGLLVCTSQDHTMPQIGRDPQGSTSPTHSQTFTLQPWEDLQHSFQHRGEGKCFSPSRNSI